MAARAQGEHPFERGLTRNAANHQPLTPLTQLPRVAAIWPEKTAVIHGARRTSYREFYARCRRLASALTARGIGPGDTVTVMAPNVPALLEAHFGVPMAGAVLNALNIRLDARTIAFILEHAETRLLLIDREVSPVIAEALAASRARPEVIDIDDPLAEGGELLGTTDYESLLAEGDPDFDWPLPTDEWAAIALNYTSGTTGSPKGVVYHHRGAALNTIGQILAFGLARDSVYLWTLPMFHCNGWCYTWAVSASGGTHVCLRRMDPALVFAAIPAHGITHMCGAPVVLNMLVHAPAALRRPFPHTVEVATGGAAPPSAVIAAMAKMGFHVVHLYGLTESYGPASLCAWQEDWDTLSADAQAAMVARQGVPYPTLDALMVAHAQTMVPVPADGATMGEVMLRGNTVMKGYLKAPAATAEAFRAGWLHTGDLGVVHGDGYLEIKDRAKDIIISGGENVSSIEIEEALTRHPAVMEAAVVARPDQRWGESPCAFVTLADGAPTPTDREIAAYCREHIARYKVPRTVVFGPLPKTATGKIQKYVLRERAAALGPRPDGGD